MSAADVERAVCMAMTNAQEYGHWLAGNQTAVRYALVDPILWSLGWSTWSPLQCQPNCNRRQRGTADYVLFGPDGDLAALVDVTTATTQRPSDRQRLMAHCRGLKQGIAVLTSGTMWEIYDLKLRTRFTNKLVGRLFLSSDRPDPPEEAARTLHHWLSQDLWWKRSA